MKKNSQQSRSGWGGKRKGAGAPLGNTNAVKHGERSRRAFFPFEGGEALSPLVRNRARNLMLAERYGLLLANNPTPGTDDSNGNGGNNQGTTDDTNTDEYKTEQSKTEESVATGERAFSLWYALSAAIASLGAGLALTGKKRRKDEE